MLPKAIIIIGSPAVGKYTIGKSLSQKCNYHFLHEHQLMDIAAVLFDDDTKEKITYYFKLRLDVFADFIKYNNGKSIVTTFVHLFNKPYYNAFMASYLQLFCEKNYQPYIIELEASFEERLKRNLNPDRLQAKPSKQNIVHSTEIINRMQAQRPNSNFTDTIFNSYPHLNLNTEILSVEAITNHIIDFINTSEYSLNN